MAPSRTTPSDKPPPRDTYSQYLQFGAALLFVGVAATWLGVQMGQQNLAAVPSLQSLLGSSANCSSPPESSPAVAPRDFTEVAGPRFRIFRPLDDLPSLRSMPSLLAPPEEWVLQLQRRLEWLEPMVVRSQPDARDVKEKARAAYTQALLSYVSAFVFRSSELSVKPKTNTNRYPATPFEPTTREGGADWTFLGDTMTGFKRLDNVDALLRDVFTNSVPGDYIETGVWRGGSSILARGVMRAHGEGNRLSFVSDSFSGLPPGDPKLSNYDMNWDHTPYLEVDVETVAQGFQKAGVMDENVVFVKGFFNDTMPELAKIVDKFAIIRFDGDMYKSAVDVLYNVYDKLSVGGYFIVDDWNYFPSKDACLDFLAVHNISTPIVPIDSKSVYWKKTEDVVVQTWRYEKSQFKA